MILSRTVILLLAAAVAAVAAPGSYARLPLHFEPNRGQTGAAEVFAARGDGVEIGLEPAGASLRFKSADVRLTLPGANPKAALIGERPLPGRSNYLRGADPSGWLSSVPHFGAVKAAGVYPGIDVVYYGAGRSLEYDFNAAAGSDPARIEIAFGGIDRMRIDDAGDLVLDTAAGEVRQRRPLAWQEAAGVRTPVRVAYEMRGRNRVGFDIGRYDRSRPLVIDPVLVFASYLGGPGIDDITAIALDRQGNIYVTGRTNSTKFPTTAGSYQPNNPGGYDLFVTKLNPSGTALIYSTYVGSGETSQYSGLLSNGIAVDGDGNAYVIGSVSSPQSLPTTPDAMYKLPGSNSFLFKLSASGSALLYSSFLPYPLGASAVAVDGHGYIYIAGSVSAPDFTGTAGAVQRLFNGMIDAFVLRLDRSAKSIVWATLLGGAGEDRGSSIAVDAAGNVYLSGTTGSSDFPVTTGAAQTTLAGGTDAFLAKINPTGTALLYSTFAGGPKRDSTNSMALDSGGSAYLLAYTEGAFPVTSGTAPAPPGFAVVKLNSSGTALEYSKVLEGCSWSRMAVDSGGQAILTGSCADTSVTGGAFALSESRQTMLMKLSADANEVLYKSFLTNSGTISVTGLAVDAAGDAYVAGTGMYYVLPVTPGVFQPEWSKGSWDDREGFVLRARVGQFHGGNFLITPKTLSFKLQIGQALPDALSIPVTAAGAPVALTVSTADTWIAADISARQTPAALNVSLRTAGLSPGKYTGSVTIASAASPDYSLSLPVQLEVIQANVITVTPASIDLTQQIGDVPVNGTSLEITSAPTGAPVTVTSSGGDWLSIRSIYTNKTPVSAWVGVDPSKVQPGTYTGKIVITSPGAANTPIEVPVKYTVKALPPMTVSVSRIDITYVKGRPAPAAATFEVRTGDASVPIQVWNSLGNAFWSLSCTNNSRSPTTCSVSFDPNAVEARTYTGGINVSVREGQLYRTYIPVRLNVATEHPLDMLPASVDLTYRKLAPKLPDFTLVPLNSDPPAVFSLSSPSVPWLSVTWGDNKTPTYVYLQILPAARDMNPGVYTSSFTVSNDAWGGSRTVPVTLTITDAAQLSVSPTPILMEFNVGQMMFSTGLFVTAGAYFIPVKIQHDDVPWLFQIPHETTTPAKLNVGPRATEPGTYETKLTFSSPEAGNTIEVPIKLVISQPPPPGPEFQLASLVNAASYTPGEVAPGEIVTLFGKGLGPANLIHNAPQARRFGTEVGGTRVYFGGVAAPMIYSSAGQVAAIVPYAVTGSTRTEVVVEYNGNRTTAAVLAVAPTAAGLFSADASGKGNAAALNYNDADGTYSYNSAANPIRRGGIIVLFGTGEGQTAPAGIDGQLVGSDVTRPLSDIAVEIGGRNATVLYSGGSPDSVAGLFQINVKVPEDITPSQTVPVRFRAGGAWSQAGVTITVK